VVWDEDQYRPVGGQDPLEAKVYEYRIDVIVSLTKISLRNVKSVTRASGLAGTMANAVKTRDGRCWVTGSTIITVNSHVCPKRMGNEQGAFIYSRYTGSPAPPGLTIYDPCFGICLCKNFDTFFDIYGIGFRKILDGNGQIQYRVHNFSEHNLDRLGYAFANSTTQPVHGFIITPPDPTSPPPGLMYWHYLQCVIRRFGHRMFRESDNIVHFEQPMPMEGDSQDGDEDESGFWPTAMLDLGSMYKEHLGEKLKKHEETASWVESSATVTLT